MAKSVHCHTHKSRSVKPTSATRIQSTLRKSITSAVMLILISSLRLYNRMSLSLRPFDGRFVFIPNFSSDPTNSIGPVVWKWRVFGVKKERKVTRTVKKIKANWISHVLHRNWILKHVTAGKIEGSIEVTGRPARIHKQILYDLKEKRALETDRG